MEGCFVNSYPCITSGGLFLSKEFKAIHKEIPLNLLALRSFVKDSTSGQALACTFRAVAGTPRLTVLALVFGVCRNGCLLTSHSIIFIMGLCGYQGRIATKSRGNLHLDNPITT